MVHNINHVIIIKFKTDKKIPSLQLFVWAVAAYSSQGSIFFSPSCILHFTNVKFVAQTSISISIAQIIINLYAPKHFSK